MGTHSWQLSGAQGALEGQGSTSKARSRKRAANTFHLLSGPSSSHKAQCRLMGRAWGWVYLPTFPPSMPGSPDCVFLLPISPKNWRPSLCPGKGWDASLSRIWPPQLDPPHSSAPGQPQAPPCLDPRRISWGSPSDPNHRLPVPVAFRLGHSFQGRRDSSTEPWSPFVIFLYLCCHSPP